MAEEKKPQSNPEDFSKKPAPASKEGAPDDMFAEGDQAESGRAGSVSVPLIITRQDRLSLGNLGYSKNDVGKMTPPEAKRIIGLKIRKQTTSKITEETTEEAEIKTKSELEQALEESTTEEVAEPEPADGSMSPESDGGTTGAPKSAERSDQPEAKETAKDESEEPPEGTSRPEREEAAKDEAGEEEGSETDQEESEARRFERKKSEKTEQTEKGRGQKGKETGAEKGTPPDSKKPSAKGAKPKTPVVPKPTPTALAGRGAGAAATKVGSRALLANPYTWIVIGVLVVVVAAILLFSACLSGGIAETQPGSDSFGSKGNPEDQALNPDSSSDVQTANSLLGNASTPIQGREELYGEDRRRQELVAQHGEEAADEMLKDEREAAQKNILENKTLKIYEAGRQDIQRGEISIAILKTLEYLASKHSYIEVSLLKSGAPEQTTFVSPGQEEEKYSLVNDSAHADGQAVRITAVDKIKVRKLKLTSVLSLILTLYGIPGFEFLADVAEFAQTVQTFIDNSKIAQFFIQNNIDPLDLFEDIKSGNWKEAASTVVAAKIDETKLGEIFKKYNTKTADIIKAADTGEWDGIMEDVAWGVFTDSRWGKVAKERGIKEADFKQAIRDNKWNTLILSYYQKDIEAVLAAPKDYALPEGCSRVPDNPEFVTCIGNPDNPNDDYSMAAPVPPDLRDNDFVMLLKNSGIEYKDIERAAQSGDWDGLMQDAVWGEFTNATSFGADIEAAGIDRRDIQKALDTGDWENIATDYVGYNLDKDPELTLWAKQHFGKNAKPSTILKKLSASDGEMLKDPKAMLGFLMAAGGADAQIFNNIVPGILILKQVFGGSDSLKDFDWSQFIDRKEMLVAINVHKIEKAVARAKAENYSDSSMDGLLDLLVGEEEWMTDQEISKMEELFSKAISASAKSSGKKEAGAALDDIVLLLKRSKSRQEESGLLVEAAGKAGVESALLDNIVDVKDIITADNPEEATYDFLFSAMTGINTKGKDETGGDIGLLDRILKDEYLNDKNNYYGVYQSLKRDIGRGEGADFRDYIDSKKLATLMNDGLLADSDPAAYGALKSIIDNYDEDDPGFNRNMRKALLEQANRDLGGIFSDETLRQAGREDIEKQDLLASVFGDLMRRDLRQNGADSEYNDEIIGAMQKMIKGLGDDPENNKKTMKDLSKTIFSEEFGIDKDFPWEIIYDSKDMDQKEMAQRVGQYFEKKGYDNDFKKWVKERWGSKGVEVSDAELERLADIDKEFSDLSRKVGLNYEEKSLLGLQNEYVLSRVRKQYEAQGEEFTFEGDEPSESFITRNGPSAAALLEIEKKKIEDSMEGFSGFLLNEFEDTDIPVGVLVYPTPEGIMDTFLKDTPLAGLPVGIFLEPVLEDVVSFIEENISSKLRVTGLDKIPFQAILDPTPANIAGGIAQLAGLKGANEITAFVEKPSFDNGVAALQANISATSALGKQLSPYFAVYDVIKGIVGKKVPIKMAFQQTMDEETRNLYDELLVRTGRIARIYLSNENIDHTTNRNLLEHVRKLLTPNLDQDIKESLWLMMALSKKEEANIAHKLDRDVDTLRSILSRAHRNDLGYFEPSVLRDLGKYTERLFLDLQTFDSSNMGKKAKAARRKIRDVVKEVRFDMPKDIGIVPSQVIIYNPQDDLDNSNDFLPNQSGAFSRNDMHQYIYIGF